MAGNYDQGTKNFLPQKHKTFLKLVNGYNSDRDFMLMAAVEQVRYSFF